MKVKEKYSKRGGFAITTATLIARGASDRDGQIKTLEAQITQLTEVVATLIDRSGITGVELLKLTGCEHKYDVDDVPNAKLTG